MKWGIILILCVLLSLNYASARDIELKPSESYTRGNIRITLVKIDDDYEKVVLCVNNEKQIVKIDQPFRFENADLEVEHIDEENKTTDIDISWLNNCEHCKCEGDCLNDKCGVEQESEDVISEPVEKNNKVEPKIEVKSKPNYVLMASIPLIGILIGIILAWLLWFRKMSF